MDGVAGRQRDLGHLLRRLALAHDAREVLLRRVARLLAVRARDDPARERELRLHRLAGRRRLLHHEPAPLGSSSSGIRIVRPNCSSGGAVSGMLLPTRRAHLRAVPRSSSGVVSDDLRLEPVGLHDVAAGEQVVELVGAAELDVGLDATES